MIDPKELRLGNLVKTNKGILIQANGIRHDWEAMDYIIIDKNDIGYSIDELSPIHITPEWLERLGLNDHSFEFSKVFTVSYYDGIVHIEQYHEGPKDMPHIIYIHQLQNLYHALTGQELTVKELTPTL